MMINRFLPILFLLGCLTLINSKFITVSSVSSLSTALDVPKEQENSPISICSLHGFSCENGNKLKNFLFKESIESSDVALVEIESPSELCEINGGDIIVCFMGRVQQISNSEESLAVMQAFIDIFTTKKTSSKLILLVEGTEQSVIQHWLQTLSSMIVDADLEDQIDLEIRAISTEDLISSEKLPIIASNIKDLLNSTLSKTGSGMKPAQLNSYLNSLTKSESTISKTNADAALACQELPQSFSKVLQQKIKLSMKKITQQQVAGINESIALIQDAVDLAIETHYQENQKLFDTYQNTDALRAVSYQGFLELITQLLPVYRTLAEAVVQGAMINFERAITKVRVMVELPKLLNLISKSSTVSVTNNLSFLRRGFLEILAERPTDAGIFSSNPSECSWFLDQNNGFSTHHTTSDLFNYELEKTKFQNFVKESSKEQVSRMFLQGAYNPYIRNRPFPPTHINLNYLIDPRTLSLDLEYSNLYDEHKPGPVKNRADPLLFPGAVASFPFDPTAHPVPREQDEPWWKLLKDFFTK